MTAIRDQGMRIVTEQVGALALRNAAARGQVRCAPQRARHHAGSVEPGGGACPAKAAGFVFDHTKEW